MCKSYRLQAVIGSITLVGICVSSACLPLESTRQTGGGQPSRLAKDVRPRVSSSAPEWGFFNLKVAAGALEGLPDLRWSRITGMIWTKLEQPPGSGRYNWEFMDDHVRRAQSGNYNLVFVLKAGNSAGLSEAACQRAVKSSGNRDAPLVSCPPQARYEEAWKRLVGSVIERYDGDGWQDMRGLSPDFRLDLQIENEAGSPHYWSPDEKYDGKKVARSYLRLLNLAYEAKQETNPATLIIATGFYDPDMLVLCERKGLEECKRPFFLRNRDFTLEVLNHPESFDVVDLHLFTYYRFSPRFVEDSVGWLRRHMAERGYQKPIFSLEWSSTMMMDLRREERMRRLLEEFPYRADFAAREEMTQTYKRLAAPENRKYRVWFETEQAKDFAKLFTSILANGVERLIHVQFHDYFGQGWDSLWWNWQGIVRFDGTKNRPVVIRKPSFYAYEMLSKALSGFESVEPLAVKGEARVYRFSFSDRPPIWVGWLVAPGERVMWPQALVEKKIRVRPLVTSTAAGGKPVLEPEKTVPVGDLELSDVPVIGRIVEPSDDGS